ncbi:hypothetical protein, partial [Bacillus mycoides]|uniref:hypothetical protein n=1 Tax=Bacillus mycoides TaxID=1405 RepID=UPI003A812CB0
WGNVFSIRKDRVVKADVRTGMRDNAFVYQKEYLGTAEGQKDFETSRTKPEWVRETKMFVGK